MFLGLYLLLKFLTKLERKNWILWLALLLLVEKERERDKGRLL